MSPPPQSERGAVRWGTASSHSDAQGEAIEVDLSPAPSPDPAGLLEDDILLLTSLIAALPAAETIERGKLAGKLTGLQAELAELVAQATEQGGRGDHQAVPSARPLVNSGQDGADTAVDDPPDPKISKV